MNPLFQHSIIPSPQDICLRQSQLPLTWPRGPRFLCLIKNGIQMLTTVSFFRRMRFSSCNVRRAKKSAFVYMPLWLVIITSFWVSPFALACDEFVSWGAPTKRAYHRAHRVYPVPAEYRRWANRYLPRLWVHPDSWQPIDFEDYLAKATLVSKEGGELYLKVVFKGKGGVSTGRLLAAVNRPH